MNQHGKHITWYYRRPWRLLIGLAGTNLSTQIYLKVGGRVEIITVAVAVAVAVRTDRPCGALWPRWCVVVRQETGPCGPANAFRKEAYGMAWRALGVK